MKSAGWSTLLLGTFLATAGGGFARAEDAGEKAAVERAIDAVATADEVAENVADRSIDTGSIAPLTGPAKSGLSTLTVREQKPLRELTPAPETKPASAARPVETPAKAAEVAPTGHEKATANDATKAEAVKVEAPAIEAPKTEAAAPSAAATEKAPSTEAAGKTEAPAVAGEKAEAPAATIAPAAEAKPAEVVPSPAPVVEPVAAPQSEPTKPADDHHAALETPKVDAPKTEAAKAEPAKADEAKAEAPVPADTAGLSTSATAGVPSTSAQAGAATAALETTASVKSEPVAAKPAEPVAAAATTPAAEAPTLTPREAEIAAAHAAQVDADALKKVVEAHALEAGPADDRKDRAAIAAFYAQRAHQPVFVGTEDLTARGKVAVEHFRAAAQDGLEPRDYALPAMRAATPEGRAEAEYSMAATVLRYARHLQSGRFDPLRVSDLVTVKPPKPDQAVVLRELASASDVGAVLDGFAPPHVGYKRLKVELARLRGEVEVPVVRLPPGPVLKPGAKDARVAMLRERLGVSAVASDAEVFDPSLADVVKTFQKERGLSVSGSLNRETVAALNDESRGNGDKIADLVVNMERWRWLPRDLGELHVFVNIPDFHLDVMKGGKSIHHARVITGRPANQTPIFSETMKYVVVNPYWNVPQSIIQKEMLGKLQGGQGLSRSFEVEVGNKSVDPSTVDWSQVQARQVSIRQRPGDGNALGNIKFMFPNQHSVYIHDTSSRGLFAQSYRALSHGCVRVHEPFSFADAVLSEEPGGLGGAQLKKMLGGAEKEVSLKVQVPVHMSYFTDFVDENGQLQVRRDVYGHDAKMKRILGL